jgi:flavin reductase (DIM6/NTAB) family NADH-FMN oxidoreductase RutF
VTGRHILRSGAFAVNILGREHWAIADRFADPVGDRFGGLQVAEGPTGSPILTDGLGFVDCRVVEAIRQGDHIIVVGEAIAAGARGTGAPLAFFRGSYVSATDPPSVVRKETQQRTSAVGVNSEPGGRT